jgi:hypothetical protein
MYHSVFRVESSRKVIVVANNKRNEPDSLGTRLRGLLEELDRLINPQQPKRAPVPVPIPVRSPRPTRRDPYGR